MRIKPAGIVVEMARFTKPGRLSQFAELMSEAAQLLEARGWKRSEEKISYIEAE